MTRRNSRSVAAHAFLTLTLTCAALLALASGASADTVIVIDAPSNGPTLRQPFGITGWAIETSATANTGIDAIHVWAFPTDGAPAKFVGEAGFGPRPDVAAAYGSQYGNAGYGLTVRGLKPGEYKFAVYPHSSITGTWGTPAIVFVTVLAYPIMYVDAPANNANVVQPFNVAGWAIDFAASAAQGTGVNTVHVWAYPTSGAAPIMLGGAGEAGNYGISRPDIAAAYGSQFAASGWFVPVTNLPPGSYDLVAYSHSLVDAAFSIWQITRVTIDATLDTPSISPAGGLQSNAITISISVPSGSQVRITRDGTTPTPSSELYSGPFTLATNTSLRAAAFATGWKPSAVAGADYTFAVATPILSYPTGQYEGALTVAVGTETSGASIYWTNDGSDPTPSSNLANGVISVPVGVTWTVKAKAFRNGWTSSGIVAATYTTVFPVVQTPTASPASGLVESGQLVTLSGDPQSTIRYTTDGSMPTTSSTAYTTPFAVTAPTTVKARAFRPSYADSAVGEWFYSVRTAKPTISPAAGSVSSLPIVSITSPVPGVTIRYTTDASTPTATSAIYSGPFQATEDMTVQALAFQAGWAPSDIAGENYQTSASTDTATPPLSNGSASLATNTLAMNPMSAVLSFGLGGVAVATADDVMVSVNGVAASPALSGANVNVSGALTDGENVVSLSATDIQGEQLVDSFTVWAGNRSIPIQVLDWLSTPMGGVSVTASPAAAAVGVGFSGVTNGAGSATASNLPSGETIVRVAAPGYRSVEVQLAASASNASAVLDVDNNDFSQGLAGWYVTSPSIFVVQNAETFEGWRWCTDPVCIRGGSQGQAAAPQMVAVGSNTYSITDSSAATGTSNVTAGTNYNVRVEASPGVAGNVIATRQFKAAKGAKAVTVRYRIATSEIFAPTPMADSYAVTLQVGSSTTSDSGNVLQLSYTSSAATVWKTLTMAVAENDPITVTARVANVGDTTWPSLVEVDQISETVYSTSGELTQVIAYTRNGARLERSEPLRYLSAAPHGYGPTPGYTTISGTLTVSGPSDDRLAAISLRISRGPVFLEPLLVGTASLDAAAGQALLNRALNAGVTYTGQLFSIDSSIFALLTSDKVALQVKATTTQGRTLVLIASKPVFAWHKFPNQSGPSRYGARDVRGCLARVNGVVTETIFPCNGDDWAFPGVITLASQLQSQGISVDDFSHMNGGSWRPHASHQIGVDVDAYFPRYELRNQAAVDKLVSLLGSSLGPKIARIFVTFTPGFSAMLENVPTLPNGVQPKRVIRNVPFHGGHFHIRFASPQ